MARPKLNIDPAQVEELAGYGCTLTELAAFFNCSIDTMSDRFSEQITKGRESGKTRLRKLQWNSASSGNVTMQIWLGKQYLQQRDQIEQKIDANVKAENKEALEAFKSLIASAISERKK